MRVTNKFGLPDAIARAVANDPYNLEDTGDISVTRLIDSPRVRGLSMLHAADLEEDASERIWALLGQAVHAVIERADVDSVTEKRLYADIGGWRVSGKFDRLSVDDNTLTDYKVTSVWSVLGGVAKPEWERQLNCLRYLAVVAGYEVDRLTIVAILRDWQVSKADSGGGYPRVPAVELQVPMWPLETTENYMRERVLEHQRWLDGRSPCTAEERWERPSTYAVMKSGRKSAIRVFDTPAEAELFSKDSPGSWVEYRLGASIRCESYCPVRAFCDQRASLHLEV